MSDAICIPHSNAKDRAGSCPVTSLSRVFIFVRSLLFAMFFVFHCLSPETSPVLLAYDVLIGRCSELQQLQHGSGVEQL